MSERRRIGFSWGTGVLLSVCLLGLACGSPEPTGESVELIEETRSTPGNPPAEGFDLAGSDERAIEIADRTMEAMGGRQAWDETRFVVWNFFGFRFHVWDKWTGDIRVESRGEDRKQAIVVTMNLDTRHGSAWIDGEPVNDADRKAELLQGAYEAWINDSYWLFMPYKLKDSGVTLTSVGEGGMLDGRLADILQLEFDSVGVTPHNKYHVYVARDSGLVEQWDFFADAADNEPRFQTPWHIWQRQGRIMLSGDRGQRQVTEIAVYAEVPAAVFDSAAPTGLREATP
jgi:hypothetical protein